MRLGALSPRTDLAPRGDPATAFLPWLEGVMVYLALLALALVLALEGASSQWWVAERRTITVQLPSGAAEGAAPALVILRATEGVAAARLLSEDEVAALLEPWLGAGLRVKELPLPHLIDVRLARGATPDLLALEARLSAAVPGVEIDDHRPWMDRLGVLVAAVRLIAAVAVGLICLAAVATVIFATRTSLAVHRRAIEVLHLLGARDTYVAAQFQWRAFALTLRGSLIGLALAAGTVWIVGRLATEVGGPWVPPSTLAPLQWALLAATPLIIAAIAALTARRTVLRALARLP